MPEHTCDQQSAVVAGGFVPSLSYPTPSPTVFLILQRGWVSPGVMLPGPPGLLLTLFGVVPPPPSLVDLPSLSSPSPSSLSLVVVLPAISSMVSLPHPLLHSTRNPPCEQWLTGEGQVLKVVPRLRGLGVSVTWNEWRCRTMWVSHFLGSPSIPCHPPVHTRHPRIPFLTGRKCARVLLRAGDLVLHLSKSDPRKRKI